MSDKRKHAENQLESFKSRNRPEEMRTQFGAPFPTRTAALTAGPRGPLLVQDFLFMEELSSFDRERIPERVVHAKGGGAHGYFEVTNDITKYSKACIFSEVGKRTPIFIRFSTVAGERGAADTARDPRGFAMKFYTEEGNWDLVGNNTPIFFIRDPMLFPSFIHSQKRNPATNLKDANMVWDFMSLRAECMHQLLFTYSDRGIPDGFRHMNGYGSHTYKLVNETGEAVYCKFHSKTVQGIKNLSSVEAEKLSGTDPDHSIRDLYNAIESGDYPQWNFFIQVMTMEQADKCPFNPFDLTKIWPHGDYPLIPVGKFVLNKNPANYFAEVEQSAFSPSHVIPGIDFSPDKMLQGRLFAYKDTHYHRLGTNHMQLPINCPYRSRVMNIQRDGYMALENNQGGAPNYHPNSFNGSVAQGPPEHKFAINAVVDRYESGDDENFNQPRAFWEKVLKDAERKRTVDNIVDSLGEATEAIQQRLIAQFKQVNQDLASQIASGLQSRKRAHL